MNSGIRSRRKCLKFSSCSFLYFTSTYFKFWRSWHLLFSFNMCLISCSLFPPGASCKSSQAVPAESAKPRERPPWKEEQPSIPSILTNCQNLVPQLKHKITSFLGARVQWWVGTVQEEDVPAHTHTHRIQSTQTAWSVGCIKNLIWAITEPPRAPASLMSSFFTKHRTGEVNEFVPDLQCELSLMEIIKTQFWLRGENKFSTVREHWNKHLLGSCFYELSVPYY